MIKKVNCVLHLSGLLAFLLILPNKTIAQFSDAINPEYPVGLINISAMNIGNDILDHAGTTYEITVWDDSISNLEGIAWRVGSFTGFTSFIGVTGVKDPDVVLVNNTAGQIFALVAFYSPVQGQQFFQYYQWSNAAHDFTLVNSFPLGIFTFGTAINIDANDVGDFAIVWDEPGGVIRIATGYTSGSNQPQLNGGGASFPLNAGTFPDVACYYNTSGDNQIDVSYLNPVGVVAVDFYNLSNLVIGNTTVAGSYRSPAADFQYKNPRIACPGPFMSDKGDFTVVCEDTDGSSTWFVKGFNNNACCSPLTNISIYNDGGTLYSPYNIADVPNTKPVVTYDVTYSSVRVAWILDNSSGMLSAPNAQLLQYPISVTCDRKAQIIFNQKYLAVPSSLPPGFACNKIAISGRGSTKCNYSFHWSPLGDIFTKALDHLPYPTNLRSENPAGIVAYLLEQTQLTSDKQESTLHLTATDVAGRVILNDSGDASHLLERIEQGIEVVPSMCILTITNNNGTVLCSEKFVQFKY